MPIPALALLLAPIPATQTELFRQRHVPVPSRGVTVDALEAADLDLDGDIDLLVGGHSMPVELFLNEGDAVFADAIEQVPEEDNDAMDFAVGDLDQDGSPDIYVAGWTPDRVWLNDGSASPTFASLAGAFPGNVPDSMAVALGDVDLDGDLDAIVAGYNVNRLLVNGGVGAFATHTVLPGGAGFTPDDRGAVLIDADLDGDLDAFFSGDFFEELLLGDGAGGFGIAPVQPPDGGTTYDLDAGDVDGDGDDDVIAASCGAALQVYVSQGDGTFALEEYGFGCSETAILADVDGDLDLDGIVGTWSTDRVYLNDGTGVFGSVVDAPAPGGTTEAFTAADFDGDGDLDLVVGYHQGIRLRLFLGGESGGFHDVPSSIPVTYATPSSGALADLDGDGDLDALVGSGANPDIVLVNDGSGHFVELTDAFPADYTLRAVPQDVDGDGDVDVFAASSSGFESADRLYLNGGAADFTDVSATHLPPTSNGSQAVAFGDLDDDGHIDLVVARGIFGCQALVNGVYLGNSGVFTEVTPGSIVADTSDDIDLGDFDGDGFLDLIVANRGCGDSIDRMYLNAAGAGFVDVTATHLGELDDPTTGHALGDIDGDGDTDAVASKSWDPVHVLTNDGSGILSAVPGAIEEPDFWGETVHLDDLDGDGNLDLISGHAFEAGLHLGDGGGGFTEATELLGSFPLGVHSVASGDVDGDGDIDLWLSNESKHPVLLSNHTRQLTRRNVPTLGSSLTMDVSGPPHTPWTLAASTGLALVPWAPYGTLELHPGGLLLLTAGVLDAEGRAGSQHPVPADPVLLGFPLHWQALVGADPRFTNRETTVFTDL